MKKFKIVLGLGLLLCATALVSQVFAQSGDDTSTTLSLGTSSDWGQYLVTADGMSVYLYVLDQDGAVACVDACVNNWPPVLVEEGLEPTVSEGLDAELVGTIERPDGSTQLTYGTHPLYTFRRDTETGHTRGQALGDQFFLVSPGGEAVTAKLEAERVEVDEETMTALMSEGGLSFTTYCSVCHGAEGQGGIGPRLAGNSVVAGEAFVVNRIIDGFIDHGMPPFGHLSDRQIASIATYIRNSWGNEFGAVLEEGVAAER